MKKLLSVNLIGKWAPWSKFTTYDTHRSRKRELRIGAVPVCVLVESRRTRLAPFGSTDMWLQAGATVYFAYFKGGTRSVLPKERLGDVLSAIYQELTP